MTKTIIHLLEFLYTGAFSRPKTRPAAVTEQTGRLTWIFFVMLDGSYEILTEYKVLAQQARTSRPVTLVWRSRLCRHISNRWHVGM